MTCPIIIVRTFRNYLNMCMYITCWNAVNIAVCSRANREVLPSRRAETIQQGSAVHSSCAQRGGETEAL